MLISALVFPVEVSGGQSTTSNAARMKSDEVGPVAAEGLRIEVAAPDQETAGQGAVTGARAKSSLEPAQPGRWARAEGLRGIGRVAAEADNDIVEVDEQCSAAAVACHARVFARTHGVSRRLLRGTA